MFTKRRSSFEVSTCFWNWTFDGKRKISCNDFLCNPDCNPALGSNFSPSTNYIFGLAVIAILYCRWVIGQLTTWCGHVPSNVKEESQHPLKSQDSSGTFQTHGHLYSTFWSRVKKPIYIEIVDFSKTYNHVQILGLLKTQNVKARRMALIIARRYTKGTMFSCPDGAEVCNMFEKVSKN